MTEIPKTQNAIQIVAADETLRLTGMRGRSTLDNEGRVIQLGVNRSEVTSTASMCRF